MTRIIIITLLAIIISVLSHAQETKLDTDTLESGFTINVNIPNISGENGKVYFALYNSKAGFIQREPFRIAQGDIIEGNTTVHFSNVPKGVYAITCYHDANDNKQLDFDGFRPVEDYGSSNNPTNFGPPQFEASQFEVNDVDLNLEIKF